MRCKIIIKDEVNFKVEGLPVDMRRKLANKLKWQVPYARYMPQYKLGRWDGTVGFFGLGGNGYVNHLDVVLKTLMDNGYEVEDIEDNRQKHDLSFTKISPKLLSISKILETPSLSKESFLNTPQYCWDVSLIAFPISSTPIPDSLDSSFLRRCNALSAPSFGTALNFSLVIFFPTRYLPVALPKTIKSRSEFVPSLFAP